MELRVLDGECVASLLDMRTAIDLMRVAFERLSSGRASVPLRTHVESEASGCRTLIMPAHLGDTGPIGIKVVSVQASNSLRDLPTIHGLMVVLDSDTGRPLALLDAERLTAIRTGAATGLATDLLAREDACVAAIFGAGRQAVTQLEAVATVRPLERVLVFSRSLESARHFSTTMSSRLDLDVRPASSPAALRDADIICTATTSLRPVFSSDMVRAGVHVNAVGTFTPDAYEIPLELVGRARLVVDQREACMREAGEVVQALKQGILSPEKMPVELGEIVAGHAAERTSPDEVTIFKSVGNAVQDVVVAAYVVAEATTHNQGTTIRL